VESEKRARKGDCFKKNSTSNGADGGFGKEKMVSGGEKTLHRSEKMVDVVERRAAERRRE